MSFTTALSGLNAAANNLAVTGNNIANANTIGFKKSRSEFADVYANSVGGVSSIQPGSGVKVAEVAQQFSQGNMDPTGNSLDMGISGDGFFTLAKNPTDLNSFVYSRAGAFEVDKSGLVVNPQGQPLLAYKPNTTTVADGFSVGSNPIPISLNIGSGLPVATTTVDIGVNLDARKNEITAIFDPTKSDTYTAQTSVSIYDSLGASHTLTTYFVAGPTDTDPREWKAYHCITDVPGAPNPSDGGTPVTMQFNASGKLVGDAFIVFKYQPTLPAAEINATIDYANSTQIAQAFSVDALKQDGLAVGKLTGISIDNSGVIFANFSNGASNPLGKVALTRFANPQGLAKLGDTTWAQSANSGEPIKGEAGKGNFGSIQSGALEQSNVDLTAQLVNLITAQQSYQANAKTISTENTIIDTILNIR